MKLALSRIHFPITSLGPGRRIGVWFQGCSIRCPGCVSADTWASERGVTSVEAVVTALSMWLDEADGITISGGEPFEQAPALHELLSRVRKLTSVDILVFSGLPLEQLDNPLARMRGLIDALISDPYDVRAPQTLALRGSDNQRLNLLTPLGKERFAGFERTLMPEDMTLDVMFDVDGSAWLAGIPRRDAMAHFKAALAARGHLAVTSESRRHVPKAKHD